MNDAFTDDDLANAEDRMRQADAARTGAVIQCPTCRGMGDCPTCDGSGRVDQEAALRAGRSPEPRQKRRSQGMNLFRRIRWTIYAFIRSHDGSTPEHPRKDGSYGWPRGER